MVEKAEGTLTVEEIGTTLAVDADVGNVVYDLCIGPSLLSDVEMQSLLKIELYVLSSHY